MEVTIKDLAKLANVSKSTVSLVLSNRDEGRVSPLTRRTILDLARRHGYRSNLVAKGLAHGRTYRIGICIEGSLGQHGIWGNFSFYERLGLLCERFKNASYSITLVQVDTRLPAEDVCRGLIKETVDGLVFLNWSPTLVSQLLLPLRLEGSPTVVVGTALKDDRATWAAADIYGTFLEATRLLLKDGDRQVAFLDMDLGYNSSLKEAAFKQVVAEKLNTDAGPWMFRSESSYSHEHVLANIERALDQMPDNRAFLLADNFYANLVLYQMRLRGMRAGHNCRLIGYGETELADRCSPKLSHFSLRLEEQVDFAVKALFDQISNPSGYEPRHALLPPNYIRYET